MGRCVGICAGKYVLSCQMLRKRSQMYMFRYMSVYLSETVCDGYMFRYMIRYICRHICAVLSDVYKR